MAIISIVNESGTLVSLAPNVLHTTTTDQFYTANGVVSCTFGFEGTIYLPTTDPNYTHLKKISVVAFTGTNNQGVELCNFSAPFTGSTLSYSGGSFAAPTTSFVTYGVEFFCYDEKNVAALNQFSISAIPVYPPTILSTSAVDNFGAGYTDPNTGLLWTEIDITPTFANPQDSNSCTYWVSMDDGVTYTAQPYIVLTASNPTIKSLQLAPAASQQWAIAIFNGVVTTSSVAIPAAQLPSGSFVVSNIFVQGYNAPAPTSVSNAMIAPGTEVPDNPYNVVTSDGTQYADISPVTYNDPISDKLGTYVSITTQQVDVNGNLAPGSIEQQIWSYAVTGSGASHTSTDYQVNYIDSTYVYVRYKIYLGNRLSQMPEDLLAFKRITGPTAVSTLELCWPSGADHYDVYIGAPPTGALQANRLQNGTYSTTFTVANDRFSIAENGITASMIGSVSVNSLIGNLDITRVNNINTINIGTLSGQITISQIQNLGSFNISSFTGNLDVSRVQNLGTLSISSFTGNLDVSRVQNLGTLSISSFTGNLDVSRVQNLGTLSISSFTGNLDVSRIQNLSTFSIANFSGSLDVSKVANLTTVSVGSFSGVIVSSQIAAGLLSDLTKYSDSVRPIASITGLPALPNANYPVGAVVYNTNDGKIWRNVNGAWSSATAASDVSGALTACTIEAIDLTTLNGLITGAQIGQINASSISVVNAGAVYGGLTNASISALNITTLNGGIQANQIASINFNNTSLTGQIQATNIGSINASTINVISNQITGIQAGNITAGTITGWTINGTTINGTTINGTTINGGAINGTTMTYTLNGATLSISSVGDGSKNTVFRAIDTGGNFSQVNSTFFYVKSLGDSGAPDYIPWQYEAYYHSSFLQMSNDYNQGYPAQQVTVALNGAAGTLNLNGPTPGITLTQYIGATPYITINNTGILFDNILAINTSATFVGNGVSCPSYGVNCYSATIGSGGISCSGAGTFSGALSEFGQLLSSRYATQEWVYEQGFARDNTTTIYYLDWYSGHQQVTVVTG